MYIVRIGKTRRKPFVWGATWPSDREIRLSINEVRLNYDNTKRCNDDGSDGRMTPASVSGQRQPAIV